MNFLAAGSLVTSKKVLASKYKVKLYFSSVRTRVIPIMKRVEVGDYPSKIARIYGWSKQHVNYYLKKLQKAGLIRRKVRSHVVFYELTDRGKELLVRCEGLVFGSGVYRLHKCQVRYRIVSEGLLPRDFKKVEMVNWTALLGLEQGVSVRHTSSSWIVHVEALFGRHPAELFTMAKDSADRVAAHLRLKYGCRLAEGEICRGYEYAVDDPVAQLLSRYFTVATEKRKMDHSLGEQEGEIDHLTRDAAIEYLLMPERVKSLEGKIDAVSSQLELLLSFFKPLLQQPQNSEVHVLHKNDLSYVS